MAICIFGKIHFPEVAAFREGAGGSLDRKHHFGISFFWGGITMANRVPTEEEYQVRTIKNQLKTLSILLKNLDYEKTIEKDELFSIGISIRDLGHQLLDVDPEFFMERDAMHGLGMCILASERIKGEGLRGFSIFMDGIYDKIRSKEKKVYAEIRAFMKERDAKNQVEPDLADFDLDV